MKLSPPTELAKLCKDLGISDSQLEKLRASGKYKTEAKLIKAMQGWWLQTRDTVRFMARQQGQAHPQQYVGSALGAIDDAECVDELTQRRFTAEAHLRDQAALGELLSAMEDVRAALDERVKANPDAAKVIGKELWQVRGRIDAAKARLKRRMAA